MRRLVPFIFLILLVGLIASVPFLLPLERYRTQMADTLSQRLNRKVVIGRLEAVMFPPSMRLREVAVLAAEGEPVLQIEQVLLPLNWKALLRARIAPQAINLRGWTAFVQRDPNGTWPWKEWIGPAGNLAERSGWPVEVISFDRGECRAVDPYGPGPAEFGIQILQGAWERERSYMSINGVATSLPVPVNFLFQASGQFIPNPTWTGVLELNEENRQKKLEIKVGVGQLQAFGKSDEWRLDTLIAFLRYYSRFPVQFPVSSASAVLQGWQSRYESSGTTLQFSHSSIVGGGRVEAKGAVVQDASTASGRVEIGFQTVSLQPIESVLYGSAPLEGTATGLAQFELALSSNAWGSLNGHGAMEIKDGKYFLPESATRNLTKAKTMRYLHKKHPGFLASGLAFKKASARWQIRRAVVTFNDAFANLGDIRIAAAGSYEIPRRGLDAFARVQVHERNLQRLKELPSSYVDLGQGTPYIRPMHGRIQGTPGQWYLRAVRSSKIPPATVNRLSQTLRSK